MNVDLIPIIVAAVTTGGLTCFAVQGGLLTSAIAQIKKKQPTEENPTPASQEQLTQNATITFVLVKIIVYTVLGALLGAFGSVLSITPRMQGIIQLLAGIYMLGIALNMLNAHPVFRYFLLQPPKFLQRLIRKTAKGSSEFATPALLGLMTLFIPCGTTLAMEALAIASGNALSGALIMGTFVTFSSWIFIATGFAANSIEKYLGTNFARITATLLIVLAVLSINAAGNLLGFPYTLNSFGGQQTATETKSESGAVAGATSESGTTQNVKILVTSSGYQSDTTTLKKNVPVELTLESKNAYSCASAFSIPSLNKTVMLPPTGITKIRFTPQKSGRLVYSCSMGMYRGDFSVI